MTERGTEPMGSFHPKASVNPRSPEHNPHERLSDQGLWMRIKWWFWWGRGYRDIWLLAVTGLVVWALISIQDQRSEAVRDACNETNSRNVETKKRLRALVEVMPPGSRRNRAEQNITSTELLIDALVPVRDCEKRVRDTVGDSFF